jgi:hypothetical protein
MILGMRIHAMLASDPAPLADHAGSNLGEHHPSCTNAGSRTSRSTRSLLDLLHQLGVTGSFEGVRRRGRYSVATITHPERGTSSAVWCSTGGWTLLMQDAGRRCTHVYPSGGPRPPPVAAGRGGSSGRLDKAM